MLTSIMVMAVGALIVHPSSCAPVRMTKQLIDPVYTPLKLGAVSPSGWLLKELQLEAEGLAGHLSSFWPDIESSIWIGGTADGGLHERTPYWLNGLVPLASLLDAAAKDGKIEIKTTRKSVAPPPLCTNGTDMMYHDIGSFPVKSAQECHDRCLDTAGCVGFVVDLCTADVPECWLKNAVAATTSNECRCWGTVGAHPDPPAPPLKDQVAHYLGYILKNQLASGWLGPQESTGVSYWARFPLLLALCMHAESIEGEPEYANATRAIVNYVLEQGRRMKTVPLDSWAQQRGMDFALSVQWLLDNGVAVGDTATELFQLLLLTQKQTADWEQWFETWTGNGGTHGVNNAQALKSAAVWYRQTGNETLRTLGKSRMTNMDRTYGLSTGLFCADEHLCLAPQMKMPSRGTELCTVVEAMFSYSTLFSVFGDVSFIERTERIAVNALPAAWASPTGGDIWAHNYLQATNQISALHQDDHVWATDGPDAELYGLAPNYGCCTANEDQGWSKYAQKSIFFKSASGIAIGAYAPASAVYPDGTRVDIATDYPFSDHLKVTVDAARSQSLHLRIPSWAHNATVTVNGTPQTHCVAGTMCALSLNAQTSVIALDLHPQVRYEQWYGNASVSVHRGALLYALPIAGDYKQIAHYAYQSNDYQISPLSDWRIALNVSLSHLTQQVTFNETGYQAGTAPFNHTHYATHLSAPVLHVPSWSIEKGSAAAPPVAPCDDPVACDSPTRLNLVPYGCTDLRMAELPLAHSHSTNNFDNHNVN